MNPTASRRTGNYTPRGIALTLCVLTVILGLFMGPASSALATQTQPQTDLGTEESPTSRTTCWDQHRFDTGHIDAFNVMLVDDEPTLNLKEDVTGLGVLHEPEDVELHVKEAALTSIPHVDMVPAEIRGKDVYFLPETQDHNLVWPGWDSQLLNGTGYDKVDITIHEVDGPGPVYMWITGGGSWLVDGGHQIPGTIRQEYLAHVHTNWAFTQPGAYYFTVNAQLKNSKTGKTATTNTAQYLFTIGDDIPEDFQNCGTETEPASEEPVSPPTEPTPEYPEPQQTPTTTMGSGPSHDPAGQQETSAQVAKTNEPTDSATAPAPTGTNPTPTSGAGTTSKPPQNQTGNEQSETPQTGTNQTGTGQPGTDQPGANQPGANQTGSNQPGSNQPGSSLSGSQQASANSSTLARTGADHAVTTQLGLTLILIATGLGLFQLGHRKRKHS